MPRSLLAAFGIFGVVWGTWVVTIADVAREVHLSPAGLGLYTSLGATASLPSMWISSRFVDRHGSRLPAVIGLLAMAAALVVTATLVRSTWGLAVVLLALYGAGAFYDVAINTSAAALERSTGVKIMPFVHGSFSGGGAMGAFGTGAALAAGVSYRQVHLTLAVALVGHALVLTRAHLPSAARPPHPSRRFGMFRLFVSRRSLALLGVIAAAVLLTEGAMENWSTYYLRVALATPVFVASGGAGFFHLTMFVGRLASGAIVRRAGNLPTLFGAGLLVVAGVTLATLTTTLPVVLAGFAVVGLALSAAFPVTLSLAGEAAPDRTAEAVAGVTLMGYSGFLVGPAVFGVLGDRTSLRTAFLAFVVTGLFVAIAARSRALRATQKGD